MYSETRLASVNKNEIKYYDFIRDKYLGLKRVGVVEVAKQICVWKSDVNWAVHRDIFL